MKGEPWNNILSLLWLWFSSATSRLRWEYFSHNFMFLIFWILEMLYRVNIPPKLGENIFRVSNDIEIKEYPYTQNWRQFYSTCMPLISVLTNGWLHFFLHGVELWVFFSNIDQNCWLAACAWRWLPNHRSFKISNSVLVSKVFSMSIVQKWVNWS